MSAAESHAPFLHLPFAQPTYEVTEGWHYSQAEKSIHGFAGHGGIDFKLPRGAKVLAAADGLAIASYFSLPLARDNQPVFYQGKRVGMGLGFFVQIYHPQAGLHTSYGHLERVDLGIKFHKPHQIGEKFWPVGHKIDPTKLLDYAWVTEVKKGQVIGYVGDSGLTLGYQDYPKRPDLSQFPSWDEVHLHFEVFRREGSRKRKSYVDPYGIKGEAGDYPDSVKTGSQIGTKSPVLWVLGKDSLPQFAG